MIRYGGWITAELEEEFCRYAINGNIEFLRSIETDSVSFYIVYFTDRVDELVFRLKYPKMIKEIDNA